jgi:Protein of unknown function (DUF3429)
MSAPPPAALPPDALGLRLGYAGLLPFVFGALLAWLVHPEVHPFVLSSLAAYAALIVSFLGGIHWGLGLLRREAGSARFVWGIAPMLLAWLGLLMPSDAGLTVQGVLLIVCYLVDRRIYPELGLQAWLPLRLRLTGVASVSCFMAVPSTL